MGGTVEDPFALAGTILERRFAIERPVAQGGFGVVYLARHLTLNRPVALKVLVMPRGLGAREKRIFLEGFEREAQTVAALEHPAIVRAYDFGVSRQPGAPELPWLALEWIEGLSLEAYLQRLGGRALAPAEALAILRPVFHGLAFAHERRVAHRDVKPANIVLTAVQGGAQGGLAPTRLLDFGIAKAMSPEESVGSGETRTLAAFRALSPWYAAPEQKAGVRSGPWTDVHALGLVLTEMLTGSKPYPGDNRLEVDQRILSPMRPTPGRFGVDVGPWEAVIAKAVALRAPDRHQDAGSFLAALDGVAPRA